jgi:hypothetical protein
VARCCRVRIGATKSAVEACRAGCMVRWSLNDPKTDLTDLSFDHLVGNGKEEVGYFDP